MNKTKMIRCSFCFLWSFSCLCLRSSLCQKVKLYHSLRTYILLNRFSFNTSQFRTESESFFCSPQHDTATNELNLRDGILQVINAAWLSPNAALRIQALEFKLGFSKLYNIVSSGQRILSFPFHQNSKRVVVYFFLRNGFHLETMKA